MKERPILFSAPMVRAILSGAKTQTRRIAPIEFLSIKSFDDGITTWGVGFTKPIGKGRVHGSYSGTKCTQDQARQIIASQFCPHGAPGDVLWVRETWAPCEAPIRSGFFQYAADGAIGRRVSTSDGEDFWMHNGHTIGISDPSLLGVWVGKPSKWRPSIHMPRQASRLKLRIKSVRVERLRDISEADARAEGCFPSGWAPSYSDPDNQSGGESLSAREDFAELWQSINGAGSWDANPFVWVIEFERMENKQ